MMDKVINGCMMVLVGFVVTALVVIILGALGLFLVMAISVVMGQ